MKNKNTKRNILLLMPMAFCLFSCGSWNSIIENYTVTRLAELDDQRVFQISPAWNIDAFSSVQVKVDWKFSSTALFFDKDCPLSSDELKSLPKDIYDGFGTYCGEIDFSNFDMQDEKYACTGTDYYTYTPKESMEGYTVTIDSNDYYGAVALFYSCSIREYWIRPKGEGDIFSVWVQTGDLLPVVKNV